MTVYHHVEEAPEWDADAQHDVPVVDIVDTHAYRTRETDLGEVTEQFGDLRPGEVVANVNIDDLAMHVSAAMLTAAEHKANLQDGDELVVDGVQVSLSFRVVRAAQPTEADASTAVTGVAAIPSRRISPEADEDAPVVPAYVPITAAEAGIAAPHFHPHDGGNGFTVYRYGTRPAVPAEADEAQTAGRHRAADALPVWMAASAALAAGSEAAAADTPVADEVADDLDEVEPAGLVADEADLDGAEPDNTNENTGNAVLTAAAVEDDADHKRGGRRGLKAIAIAALAIVGAVCFAGAATRLATDQPIASGGAIGGTPEPGATPPVPETPATSEQETPDPMAYQGGEHLWDEAVLHFGKADATAELDKMIAAATDAGMDVEVNAVPGGFSIDSITLADGTKLTGTKDKWDALVRAERGAPFVEAGKTTLTHVRGFQQDRDQILARTMANLAKNKA
ncbi:MAG TPA: hypothetical protein VLF40_01620 [Candidatus Saccharimonadales bacterium]|nr:hypothetical protein [Candidatus Saccharimonadales bacterium]